MRLLNPDIEILKEATTKGNISIFYLAKYDNEYTVYRFSKIWNSDRYMMDAWYSFSDKAEAEACFKAKIEYYR